MSWNQSSSLNHWPPDDRVVPVTQRELAEYLALIDQRQQLGRQRRGRRQGLVEKLAAGARVEPGALVALIRRTETPHLSARKLAVILGEERALEILDAIEPTARTTLVVRRR